MIKCVIFDLGDVIVRNNPARTCKKLVKNCTAIHDEVAWFAPKKFHKLIDAGKVSSYELYKIAAKNLGVKGLTHKRFREAFADIFTNNKPVQKLARQLSKNYRLLLLSNTNTIHFAHLKKRFPIMRLFRHSILSYKVGHLKPQSRIYRIAVKKSGARAGECLFIDNTKANVTGARKAGLKAVQYTTTAKLKKDLKRLRVKF